MPSDLTPTSIRSDPHPELPERSWVVTLQPRAEPYRIAFDPAARTFHTTQRASLLHVRGFDGVYGWITGFGEPPGRHLAALLLTLANPRPGAVLEAGIHGLTFLGDGNPVLLTIDAHDTPSHGATDIAHLPRSIRFLLDQLDTSDGPAPRTWLDQDAARGYVADLLARSRRTLDPFGWPAPETWHEPADATQNDDDANWTW